MVDTVAISDYTAKGFLQSLCDTLSLSYDEEGREYCTRLSKSIGKGFIKSYDFDFGVSVYEFDCFLKKELQLILEKGMVQPLIILFNRENAITHAFKGEEHTAINHLESVLVCAGSEYDNSFVLHANQSSCMLAIAINRKKFEKKISDFVHSMDKNLERIFRDVNGINSFFSKGHYSLDIAKFLEEFSETELTGFMKHVFLEGKTYEILIHLFKQYLDDEKKPENRRILRQSTVNKIEEASAIIEEELESVGSVLSIAKRVGLNQNTLQDGFKKLFKKSVNQYIKEARLDKAKELMENSEFNITEITYQVGINSRSYFSKLFKERFGISPKDYLSRSRKDSGSDISA